MTKLTMYKFGSQSKYPLSYVNIDKSPINFGWFLMIHNEMIHNSKMIHRYFGFSTTHVVYNEKQIFHVSTNFTNFP